MRQLPWFALVLAVSAATAQTVPAPRPAPAPAAPAAPSTTFDPATRGAPSSATLVWLVVDDGTRKTIASAAQVAALGALTETAAARGVALEFPQLDGNDLARIDADTLWSGDTRKAYVAAQRYGTPTVLVARLSRNGALWQGRMTLIDAFGREDYSAQHPDSSSVLVDAASGLAERLAKRRVALEDERVVADHELWIAGVSSARDYGRVLKYLESLPVVESVMPQGADGDRLLVKARLTVRLERLQQLLALGSTLALDDPASANGPAVLRLLP
jgi:uncharacterized protein